MLTAFWKMVAVGVFTLGTLGTLPSRDAFFDLSEGIALAELAAVSYCNPSEIGNWTCKRCAEHPGFVPSAVVYDPEWNLQAYVGRDARRGVLVVFRGTVEDSLENWKNNFMTFRTKVAFPGMPPDAKVHDGFYRSWTKSTLHDNVINATRAELMSAEFGSEAPPVTVVGHSLGGALATLCAAELVTELELKNVRLYTFGCPRVGNAAFAKALMNSTLVHKRVTHDRDVIPSVPYRHMGYHHTAREVWERTVKIPGTGGLTVNVEITCDASGEDPMCQDSVCGIAGSCASVADHLMYLGVNLASGNC